MARLRLNAPSSVTRGEPLVGEVEVAFDTPTRVDLVVVAISSQSWWRATGDPGNAIELELGRAEFRPHEVSTARFPFRFEIPPWVPYSHAAFDTAWATLRLRAHVHASGEVDRHELAAIAVVPASVDTEPIAIAGKFARPLHRLVVGVTSACVVAGTEITGAISGLPTGSTVRLVFVGTLILVRPDGLSRVEHHELGNATVIGPRDDTTLTFAIATPRTASASARTTTHSVEWFLRAYLGGAPLLDVPLDVRGGAPELAPAIFEASTEPVFTTFANEHGWRLDSRHDRPGVFSPTVRRDVDAHQLEVTYVRRGHATVLVTRIAYSTLALGLAVVPRSPLRGMLGGGVRSNVGPWDRRHRVKARVRDGAEALVRAIVPELPDALGPVVRWTDLELVCERRVREPELAAVLREVADAARAVAGRLARHRASRAPIGPYR